MSGYRTGRDLVPIVPLPSEFVDEWSERQAGVSEPSADHDCGAFIERLYQRSGTEINVCRLDLVLDRRQRLAGFHIRDVYALGFEFFETAENVVTRYDSDLYFSGESTRLCLFLDRLSTADNVHAAGI